MIFISDFSLKNKNDVQPGELIRLASHGGRPLGIVAPPMADGQPKQVLTLEATERAGAFRMFNLQPDNVVSFGLEWLLETHTDPSSSVGNRDNIDALGVIRRTIDDIFLHCRSVDGFHDEFYFSLNNWQNVDILQDPVVPVFEWDIWASRGHRERRGATPLLTFRLAPGAQAAR